MDKVSDKFTNELDIMNLLAKIRQSHEIIDKLLSSKKRELLKFSKDRVVNLTERSDTDSENSSSSSSDDNLLKK